MDSIMDNQEVTDDIMTNISVDLGNDDLYFSQTEKFGTDKLNQITGDLVSSGILSGGANAGNNCEVFVSNSKIYIKSGIMVFADGKKKTITENLQIGSVGEAVYIYALNNILENRLEIKLSSSRPSNGDYVLLASVSANGTVSDLRKFCIAKFSDSGARLPQTLTNLSYNIPGTSDYVLIGEINLLTNNIAVVTGEQGNGSCFMWRVYDDFYSRGEDGFRPFSQYSCITDGNWVWIKFRVLNGKLQIYGRYDGSKSGASFNVSKMVIY